MSIVDSRVILLCSGAGRQVRRARPWAPVALAVLVALVAGTGTALASERPTRFAEVDLVSDQPGKAAITDPLLVNSWGLALGPTTPLSRLGNRPVSAAGSGSKGRVDAGGLMIVMVKRL